MKFKTFEFWILNLGVIALGLFMLSRPVYAATIIYDGTAGDNSCSLTGHSQYVAGKFTSTENQNLLSVMVNMKNNGSPANFYARIFADSAGSPSGGVLATSSLTAVPTDSVFTNRTFSFSGFTLTSADYWVEIIEENISTYNFQVKNNTSYPSLGTFRGFSGGATPPSGSPANDCGGGVYGVSFNGTITTGYLDPTIELVFPTSSEAVVTGGITPDFTNWVVSIANPPLVGWYPAVEYNQLNMSRVTSTDALYQSFNPSQLSALQIPKSSPLAPANWTYMTTWVARPYVALIGSSTRYYGSWSEFYVSNGVSTPTTTQVTQNAGPFNNSIFNGNLSSTTLASSSLENAFAVDCSMFDNSSFFSSATIASIGCTTRQSFGWLLGQLIFPHDTIKNYFNWSLSVLSNGFPFNFVFTTVNTTKAVIENPDFSSSTLGIYLPMAGNINVITPTTLEDIFGSSTAATIRTIESSLLWIGTVVAVVAMIL